MEPVRWIAVGLMLVVVDFRTESLDLLPDPVGWALVGLGAWRLGQVRTTGLAALAAVLSLGDAALPYRYVRIDPRSGEVFPSGDRALADLPLQLRFDPVSGWRLALLTLAVAAAGATVWSLLRGLIGRADRHGATIAAGRLRRAGWLVAGTWVVPYLVAVGLALADDGRFDPIWNRNAEYIALLGVLSVGYLVVVLVTDASAGWARPDRAWTPTPWDAERLRRAAGERED